MFIVQVKITVLNNSMETSWSSGLPRRFVMEYNGREVLVVGGGGGGRVARPIT